MINDVYSFFAFIPIECQKQIQKLIDRIQELSLENNDLREKLTILQAKSSE